MSSKKLKNTLRDFFSFSRGERNGIIILFFCILATSIFRFLYPLNKIDPATESKYQAQVIKLEKLGAKRDSFTNTNKNNYSVKSSGRYNKVTYKPKAYKVIELNSTDTFALDELPGIGSAYARRIIKYRDLLGGYYNKDQVLEVYGMKPENFVLFKNYIRVDTLLIMHISLNTGTFKEINAHPYISYEQTKSIFRYRNKGLNINMELLRKNNVFDSAEIKKLLPYLIFSK
jgi:DNA uptake protein ComE-like DNA-binding protein